MDSVNAAIAADTAEWRTGQRVPFTGDYVDQYGYVSHHEQYKTFPPVIGRKGECAYRRLVATTGNGASLN